MRPGLATFLIGAAFAVLLALAFATVVLGVITALRMPKPDETTDLDPRDQGPTRGTPT
ncbi:hypothetical protein [Kitasatospora sp. NPDC097643]|uniref:hypothetical protein n=1 Tax=Kitasatospora sp. NPDC097643 TaxID=3157230 RepID=UPI00332A4E97